MPDEAGPRAALDLPSDLLDEAEALGVDAAEAAEAGVARAIKAAREAAWKAENAEAIRSYNDWVEKNGLPLADIQVLKI